MTMMNQPRTQRNVTSPIEKFKPMLLSQRLAKTLQQPNMDPQWGTQFSGSGSGVLSLNVANSMIENVVG